MQRAAMDGDTYERWVAGYDVETGEPKGRLRTGGQAVRFVEVVVNGPKTWSLAAAVHPEIAAAYDGAQERAATRDHRLAGRARDDAGGAAGPAGAGPGGGDRGRGGGAPDLAGR